MHRVTLLFDEVSSVLHELLEGHHRVVVDVEPVVSCPGFHGNQHYSCVELFLEKLEE